MPFALDFSRVPATWGWSALIAATVAVIAIYLLRPPPQPVPVSSLQIWEALARRQSRRKDLWRWLLSLLLSLGITLALVAAWSGMHSPTQRLERPFFVLDDSLSMRAGRSDGTSRLQAARQRLGELASNATAPMAVLSTTGSRLRIAEDRSALLEAADELIASSLERPSATVPEARFPALPAGLFEPGDVVLLTDAVSPLDPPPQARVANVFESARNVGIGALEVRFDAANPLAAYLTVYNDSAETVEPRLDVRRKGEEDSSLGSNAASPLASERLRLAPDEVWSGRLRLPSDTRAGRIEAVLTLEGDLFAADDRAVARFDAARIRVLCDLDDDSPLYRSLRASPIFEVIPRSGTAGARLDPSEVDLAVLARTTPSQRPTIPVVLFAPAPVDWLASPSARALSVRPDVLQIAEPNGDGEPSPASPIAALPEVEIDETAVWSRDSLPAAAAPITAQAADTASEEADQIVGFWMARSGTGQSGGAAPFVVFGFDPGDSNITRLPLFPVVLEDLLRSLVRSEASQTSATPAVEGARTPINQQLLVVDSESRWPTSSGSWHQALLVGVLALLLIEPFLRYWGVTE